VTEAFMASPPDSEGLLRIVCHGTVRVALPPERALRYFTPEGERAWAAGWDPSYPVAPEDDTAINTVFVTSGHGHHTVWVVVDCGDRAMRYALVSPGVRAGTVNVRCLPDGQATRAEITYDLTALATAGQAGLQQFADGYDDFLGEWERRIAAAVGRQTMPGSV
jgi:hypothetical protein